MHGHEEFIEFMVRSGALTFGEFVTKSGRQTPYFINTGSYRTGSQITLLGSFYARAIHERFKADFDLLFGPAYKGIPLAVATASQLYQQYHFDCGFCFNRKEFKDHGESGLLVGWKPRDGDRVVIVEDVITAGTSVREAISLLQATARVEIRGLIVSVDRMERGVGDQNALREVQDAFGCAVHSIATLEQIVQYLHNRPIDGKVVLNDGAKARIDAYLKMHGVRA